MLQVQVQWVPDACLPLDYSGLCLDLQIEQQHIGVPQGQRMKGVCVCTRAHSRLPPISN